MKGIKKIVVEAIGSKRRGLAGSLYSIPYSLGYMVLPIIAYFVRDWRTLQLTCASCATLMVMTWWFIPEVSLSKQFNAKSHELIN
jgi:OCT family organic cation transporter-like MFS transporter 4/5